MTAHRQNSLEPLTIDNWRWQPFLNHACQALQEFSPEPYPIAEQFLLQRSTTGSKSKPVEVTTATWACRTSKLRQVRAACVEAGSAASVLNFVINPSTDFDLPFFGADLVTLPAGHLLALDLQPALKTDAAHTDSVWNRLIPIFERWQKRLPNGGPIPEEAKPYFSPGFLWTRLPLGEEGDSLIDEVVTAAFNEYLRLYVDLLGLDFDLLLLDRLVAIGRARPLSALCHFCVARLVPMQRHLDDHLVTAYPNISGVWLDEST